MSSYQEHGIPTRKIISWVRKASKITNVEELKQCKVQLTLYKRNKTKIDLRTAAGKYLSTWILNNMLLNNIRRTPGIKPGWPCARQKPYPLCYHSGPQGIFQTIFYFSELEDCMFMNVLPSYSVPILIPPPGSMSHHKWCLPFFLPLIPPTFLYGRHFSSLFLIASSSLS